MDNGPLIIKGLTAIELLINGTVIHYLYLKKLKKNSILIYNVHPLMDTQVLYNFFERFGDIADLHYSPFEAHAILEFKILDSVHQSMSISMNKIYDVILTELSIPVSQLKQNSEWLDDYQIAKQESETCLEEYFKNCLTTSNEPDENGWITVKRKKQKF